MANPSQAPIPFHFPLGDALALSPFDKEVWASPARLQEMQKLVGFPDDLFLRGNLGFQGFLSWGFFWCRRTGVKTLAHFKVRQPRFRGSLRLRSLHTLDLQHQQVNNSVASNCFGERVSHQSFYRTLLSLPFW
jgi:hypothetical protein